MKKILAVVTFLLFGAPAAEAACTATLPFVLQNGTLADATQVMANFNAIVNAMTASCAGSGVNSDITTLVSLTAINNSAYQPPIILSAPAGPIGAPPPLNNVLQILSNTGPITINSGGELDLMRFSQNDGSSTQYTVGGGALAVGLYIRMEELSGSSSTANMYAMVPECTLDGPGTCKAIHPNAFANSGATGVITGVNSEIGPVSTLNSAWAYAAVLDGSVDDLAIGFVPGTTVSQPSSPRFQYVFGTSVQSVSVNLAFYQAWMGPRTSAGARAFQILNSSGTEIGWWDKAGAIGSPNVVGGTTTSGDGAGVLLTQGGLGPTVRPNNTTGGNLIVASGTNASTLLLLQTSNNTEATWQSNKVNLLQNMSTVAGGQVSQGVFLGTTGQIGIVFGSGAPTLVAPQGSLYLRTDGSSTSTRAYINTNGSTGWTAITTAS